MPDEGMIMEIAAALGDFAKRLGEIARNHAVARASPPPSRTLTPPPAQTTPSPQPRPIGPPPVPKPGASFPAPPMRRVPPRPPAGN